MVQIVKRLKQCRFPLLVRGKTERKFVVFPGYRIVRFSTFIVFFIRFCRLDQNIFAWVVGFLGFFSIFKAGIELLDLRWFVPSFFAL